MSDVKTYTFNEFMKQPSEDLTNIQVKMVKRQLDFKYRTLVSKTKINIEHVCKHQKSYYVHYKIPSENTEKTNDYDVVIKFTPNGILNSEQSSVKNYNVSFFSNSPGFMYTYAYVYNEAGLFIEDLQNKFSEKVFTMEPTRRNPKKELTFDKTIYFAMKAFESSILRFNKGYLDSKANISYAKLINSIRTADQIKNEIISENNRLKIEKKYNPTNDKQVRDNKKRATNSTSMISPIRKIISAVTSTSRPFSPVNTMIRSIKAKKTIK